MEHQDTITAEVCEQIIACFKLDEDGDIFCDMKTLKEIVETRVLACVGR